MAERSRTRETRQRRVVYEAIKNTHSHPTADWILDKVRAECFEPVERVQRVQPDLRSFGLARE